MFFFKTCGSCLELSWCTSIHSFLQVSLNSIRLFLRHLAQTQSCVWTEAMLCDFSHHLVELFLFRWEAVCESSCQLSDWSSKRLSSRITKGWIWSLDIPSVSDSVLLSTWQRQHVSHIWRESLPWFSRITLTPGVKMHLQYKHTQIGFCSPSPKASTDCCSHLFSFSRFDTTATQEQWVQSISYSFSASAWRQVDVFWHATKPTLLNAHVLEFWSEHTILFKWNVTGQVKPLTSNKRSRFCKGIHSTSEIN